MNRPLLTIAIPTFNRLETLKKTLSPLISIGKVDGLEVLVIDNCSNDGTWDWLCKQTEISIKRNRINQGIEGNIIQGLFSSQGTYVWLLSDHMRVDIVEVLQFLSLLREGLSFTLGYAQIKNYGTVLPNLSNPSCVSSIEQVTLGHFIFVMGNISSFVVNSSFLEKCGRSVYRFSGFSYPHLGVFLHLDKADEVVEIPLISEFLERENSPSRLSYDTFRSRFVGFVKAINLINNLNPSLAGVKRKVLAVRPLQSALVYNSVLSLCFEQQKAPKFHEFLFCVWNYPGRIKLFLCFCLVISLFPVNIRIYVSKLVFMFTLPNTYKSAKESYEKFFYDEVIKE